jgi:hypothetical protein
VVMSENESVNETTKVVSHRSPTAGVVGCTPIVEQMGTDWIPFVAAGDKRSLRWNDLDGMIGVGGRGPCRHI